MSIDQKLIDKKLKKFTKNCLIFINGYDYVSYAFSNTIATIAERRPDMIEQTIADAKSKYPDFVLYNQL